MINRDQIISFLKDFSQNKEYVHAMWLEGADGLDKVDEYSDIDFWFDVDEDKMITFLYECIDKLKELSDIDSRVDNLKAEIVQSNIHLKNTSEYLTLDICVQSHDRDRKMTCYVSGDIAELPLVIFDKADIITYVSEFKIDKSEIIKIFETNKCKILQMSRVKKYIKRSKYLEAYMKYLECVVYPLITIARLIYIPRHYDYGLCHITDHLPKNIANEIEALFKVKDLKDIEINLEKTMILLARYEKELKDKYNL